MKIRINKQEIAKNNSGVLYFVEVRVDRKILEIAHEIKVVKQKKTTDIQRKKVTQTK